jgi:serine/threonine protein kinase
MVWAVGKTIKDGQYTIQEVLGEGRFGITYRASDRGGNSVVIKTPRDVGFKVWESERLQKLFWQEASKLKGCDHPHIVKVKELFSEGKANCMVMEYIDGMTLDRRSQKILSEKEALRYIEQIGQALMVVHSRGVLHRDIRPGNIMIRAGKPEAVLIDFGLALDFDEQLTRTRSQELAAGFAPIECYSRDAKRGAFTDIYSLGAMLYELLTGQLPVDAMTRKIDHQPLIEPKTCNLEISIATNKAILWALELEADKRPQSVQAWFKDLGLSIPKKAKSEISRPISINWTAVTATTGSLAVLLTLLTSIGVTDKIKQLLFPQPTPTVSPQQLPSAKP